MARILVAEDQEDIASLLAELREDLAHDIRTVSSEPPDLVVSDVAMPLARGMDLLRTSRGREQTRYTPVIVMSVRSVEVHEDGLVRLLPKPFDLDQVVDTISSTLSSSNRRTVPHAAVASQLEPAGR